MNILDFVVSFAQTLFLGNPKISITRAIFPSIENLYVCSAIVGIKIATATGTHKKNAFAIATIQWRYTFSAHYYDPSLYVIFDDRF